MRLRALTPWFALWTLAPLAAACANFDGFSIAPDGGDHDMGVTDADMDPDLGSDGDQGATDGDVEDMGSDTGTDDQGTEDQGTVDPGCDSDVECPGEYRCDPVTDTCHVACTVGNEVAACKPSGHCSATNTCVPDGLTGAASACTRDSMCVGNVGCVDGFCCTTASCSGCRACNVPGSLGTCTNVPAGMDVHDTCAPAGCGNDGTCNGMGGCRAVAAGTDPQNACTPNACSNDGTCNGTGACRQVAAGTDPNNHCPGTAASCTNGLCNGAGGCAPAADGTVCGGGACGSGRCSGGGCLDICSYLGEPACEYCPGDGASFCGGC